MISHYTIYDEGILNILRYKELSKIPPHEVEEFYDEITESIGANTVFLITPSVKADTKEEDEKEIDWGKEEDNSQSMRNYKITAGFKDDTSAVNSLSAFISLEGLNKLYTASPPATAPNAVLDEATVNAAV
ncbi:hypothetical protein Lpar_2559 [Legionella parisiensis]|uniref:Uncharacterized protein n=1 Tax=Legionella parisiensis TaxID=45071 RepID=A0A1E5JVG8_9GAMM|nr:hypothetical protein Lpar_2559 [Legionella parisiensis]OEH48534.1 hypothetical protein lpari_00483 [Legionella parisiensis]STX76459.1 Uncharacterised protein [Legionella parisiensis]